MDTITAIEIEIDRILSRGYPGIESKEWKAANLKLDRLGEELKMLLAAYEKINE